MSFKTYGLSAELLRAINDQGYTNPTPIQEKAIPLILKGKDVVAGAQTGTGKTAGFTLPLLQRLSKTSNTKGKSPIRALIITPTRELAAQVNESINKYGSHLPLKSKAIYGGVKINPQKAQLRMGVDILVSTPGRLRDHIGQNSVDLSKIEIFVLDEADRMLDMGFIHDIRSILAVLPSKSSRQNLFFSATFSKEINQLAESLLNLPERIQVDQLNSITGLVEHLVYPVDKQRKRELLSHRIGWLNWSKVLVFTRTKHGANRLAQQLERDGLKSDAIHSNKSQGARNRALREFKTGRLRVLVATDVAGRGLHINDVSHVINFSLPEEPEDYVHRIGRTGRAGAIGTSISFACEEDSFLLPAIEEKLGTKLDCVYPLDHLLEPAPPFVRKSRFTIKSRSKHK